MGNKNVMPGPKKNTPPVQVESLSKSFGKQTVLNGISLEIAHGETLSVLGRSGTGKSVLLKLIIGLHTPDSGSIRVNGEEVTKLPLKELNEVRKRVGFLFQQAALYDSLTI
jgi:phospholipid/cholesterol/gamma-HCH transport system ATP-binding protein